MSILPFVTWVPWASSYVDLLVSYLPWRQHGRPLPTLPSSQAIKERKMILQWWKRSRKEEQLALNGSLEIRCGGAGT